MTQIRLNKYLSSQGVASRRAIDDLIRQRLIVVNGRLASLGTKVDPELDSILISGKPYIPKDRPKLIYLALHKPKNYLSTTSDDRGRPTVIDLIKKDFQERLYPIGRLDFDSTGLILLTNDGDLTLKLTHPRYHLGKVYQVRARRSVTASDLLKLEQGIRLSDGPTLPAKTKVINKYDFEITLFEGRNRQVRRMVEALGNEVVTLHRSQIGPVAINSLPPGLYRHLTNIEVSKLLSYTNPTNLT